MDDTNREFALKNGHAPMADKVVLIDFDGTIFPFGELWSMDPPLPGAKQVTDWLHEHGYKIKIFSSRVSKAWCEEEEQDCGKHRMYMLWRCAIYGIWIDDIAMDKEPAEYYIDDKAISFNGDWQLVLDQIKWNNSRKDRNGR